MPKVKMKTFSGRCLEVEYIEFEKVEKGFKRLKDTMTQPLGFAWYSNNEPLLVKNKISQKYEFNRNFKSILVKEGSNATNLRTD